MGQIVRADRYEVAVAQTGLVIIHILGERNRLCTIYCMNASAA